MTLWAWLKENKQADKSLCRRISKALRQPCIPDGKEKWKKIIVSGKPMSLRGQDNRVCSDSKKNVIRKRIIGTAWLKLYKKAIKFKELGRSIGMLKENIVRF